MTKILSGQNKDFGLVDEFQSKVETVTIENIGTETVTLTGVDSDNADFVVNEISLEKVQPKFPANSTIYLNDKGICQDISTGAFYTTNQGYGILGTTNANGLITLCTDAPVISITSPSSGDDKQLDVAFAVTWTSSNVASLDITLESEGGYKKYEGITASLGTYNVTLDPDDGFVPNEGVTITLRDVLGIASDNVNIYTLATVTMIDDFESYSVGQDMTSFAPWNCHSWLSAVITDTYALSGTKSMKIQIQPDGGYRSKVTFSAKNMTGKSVSFALRRGNSGVYIERYEVLLYNGAFFASKLTVLTPAVSATGFTTLITSGFPGNISNITAIEIDIIGNNNYDWLYIDDVKII